MTVTATAVPAFDHLVRQGTITGYTIERDATYLRSATPTLTYRMYRDGDGAANASSFETDMRGLGASVRRTRAAGNLQQGGGIRRSAQVTVIAAFPSRIALADALLLVRARYHANGTEPVPGSWRWPDVRVTGCRPPEGMVPVVAQSGRTRAGTAVALTLASRRLLPGLAVDQVSVLDDWLDLLASAHDRHPDGICGPC